MAFFSVYIFPSDALNLSPLICAKCEAQIEQMCCQVSQVCGHLGIEMLKPRKFSIQEENCAFSAIWPVFPVDLSLSQALIWFGSIDLVWLSKGKMWLQADSSSTAEMGMGLWTPVKPLPFLSPQSQWALLFHHNTKWMLTVTGKETLSHHLDRKRLLWWCGWIETHAEKATPVLGYFLLAVSHSLEHVPLYFCIVPFIPIDLCFAIYLSCHTLPAFLPASLCLSHKFIFPFTHIEKCKTCSLVAVILAY